MSEKHGEPIIKLRHHSTSVNTRFQVEGHPRLHYIGVETVMVRFVNGRFYRATAVGKTLREDGTWGDVDYDESIYGIDEAPEWLLPYLSFTSASKLLVETENT